MAAQVLHILTEAARGRPPAADGSVDVLPSPGGPTSAVLAFTGHHVVAADIDSDEVRRRLPAGDLGAPMSAGFLLWLAGWLGCEPGVHDVLVAAPAGSPGSDVAVDLARRDDLADHPRVRRAARYRSDLQVLAADGGVLVVGRGFAGRWEFAFEVDEGARGRGLGRRLAAAALGFVPAGEPVFGQVAPGNAASLRAVLAAGYRPIGAEVLFPTGQARP